MTELTLKSLSTTHTFLLRYYGTNFALIKRYDQFCLFTVVYKEAQIHPLLTLFILFSCYSFASFFIYFLPYSQLFILSLPSLSLFLYSIIELSPYSLLYLCSPSFYLPNVLLFYFF